ncbi:unnamed protein product [Coffea canephora]|uniref:Uncharacterized protein n=1 Tax=Coffea canephora TaxID=49390 RepID=A0A068UIJ7_COFCA|nr:unnamed protein product [Coffea canephora]
MISRQLFPSSRLNTQDRESIYNSTVSKRHCCKTTSASLKSSCRARWRGHPQSLITTKAAF